MVLLRQCRAANGCTIVVFCGHGKVVGNSHYLLLYEFNPELGIMHREAIECAELWRQTNVHLMTNAFNLVVVDACRDAENAQHYIPQQLQLAESILVVYATQPGLEALDGPADGLSPLAEAVERVKDHRWDDLTSCNDLPDPSGLTVHSFFTCVSRVMVAVIHRYLSENVQDMGPWMGHQRLWLHEQPDFVYGRTVCMLPKERPQRPLNADSVLSIWARLAREALEPIVAFHRDISAALLGAVVLAVNNGSVIIELEMLTDKDNASRVSELEFTVHQAVEAALGECVHSTELVYFGQNNQRFYIREATHDDVERIRRSCPTVYAPEITMPEARDLDMAHGLITSLKHIGDCDVPEPKPLHVDMVMIKFTAKIRGDISSNDFESSSFQVKRIKLCLYIASLFNTTSPKMKSSIINFREKITRLPMQQLQNIPRRQRIIEWLATRSFEKQICKGEEMEIFGLMEPWEVWSTIMDDDRGQPDHELACILLANEPWVFFYTMTYIYNLKDREKILQMENFFCERHNIDAVRLVFAHLLPGLQHSQFKNRYAVLWLFDHVWPSYIERNNAIDPKHSMGASFMSVAKSHCNIDKLVNAFWAKYAEHSQDLDELSREWVRVSSKSGRKWFVKADIKSWIGSNNFRQCLKKKSSKQNYEILDQGKNDAVQEYESLCQKYTKILESSSGFKQKMKELQGLQGDRQAHVTERPVVRPSPPPTQQTKHEVIAGVNSCGGRGSGATTSDVLFSPDNGSTGAGSSGSGGGSRNGEKRSNGDQDMHCAGTPDLLAAIDEKRARGTVIVFSSDSFRAALGETLKGADGRGVRVVSAEDSDCWSSSNLSTKKEVWADFTSDSELGVAWVECSRMDAFFAAMVELRERGCLNPEDTSSERPFPSRLREMIDEGIDFGDTRNGLLLPVGKFLIPEADMGVSLTMKDRKFRNDAMMRFGARKESIDETDPHFEAIELKGGDKGALVDAAKDIVNKQGAHSSSIKTTLVTCRGEKPSADETSDPVDDQVLLICLPPSVDIGDFGDTASESDDDEYAQQGEKSASYKITVRLTWPNGRHSDYPIEGQIELHPSDNDGDDDPNLQIRMVAQQLWEAAKSSLISRGLYSRLDEKDDESRIENIMDNLESKSAGMELDGGDAASDTFESQDFITSLALEVMEQNAAAASNGMQIQPAMQAIVHPPQASVARNLLEKTKEMLSEVSGSQEDHVTALEKFDDVRVLIFVPVFNSIRCQTMLRFKQHSLLRQGEKVEDHVLMYKNSSHTKSVFEDFKKQAIDAPNVLHVLIADECHYANEKGSVHDKFVNDEDLRVQNNVIMLLVSASPYNVLTKNSRLRLGRNCDGGVDNMVKWFDRKGVGDSKSTYRSLRFYLESMYFTLQPILSKAQNDTFALSCTVKKSWGTFFPLFFENFGQPSQSDTQSGEIVIDGISPKKGFLNFGQLAKLITLKLSEKAKEKESKIKAIGNLELAWDANDDRFVFQRKKRTIATLRNVEVTIRDKFQDKMGLLYNLGFNNGSVTIKDGVEEDTDKKNNPFGLVKDKPRGAKYLRNDLTFHALRTAFNRKYGKRCAKRKGSGRVVSQRKEHGLIRQNGQPVALGDGHLLAADYMVSLAYFSVFANRDTPCEDLQYDDFVEKLRKIFKFEVHGVHCDLSAVARLILREWVDSAVLDDESKQCICSHDDKNALDTFCDICKEGIKYVLREKQEWRKEGVEKIAEDMAFFSETDLIVHDLLQMDNDVVATSTSPERGAMKLLRVYNQEENGTMEVILRHAKRELSFDKKFAVLCDTGQTNIGVSMESYFAEKYGLAELYKARTSDGGVAKRKGAEIQFEDLDGIPMLLIVCEKARLGDTLPQSLNCLDMRLRSTDTFASLMQELGRMCRYPRTEEVSREEVKKLSPAHIAQRPLFLYVNGKLDTEAATANELKVVHEKLNGNESKTSYRLERVRDKLPYALLDSEGFKAFESAIERRPDPKPGSEPVPVVDSISCSGGLDKRMMLPNRRLRWHLQKIGKLHDYENYEPKEKNYDYENKVKHDRRLLLCAECQVGKTGAYLHYISLLQDAIDQRRLEDDEIEASLSIEPPKALKGGFKLRYPYWKDMREHKSKDYKEVAYGKYHLRVLEERWHTLQTDFATESDFRKCMEKFTRDITQNEGLSHSSVEKLECAASVAMSLQNEFRGAIERVKQALDDALLSASNASVPNKEDVKTVLMLINYDHRLSKENHRERTDFAMDHFLNMPPSLAPSSGLKSVDHWKYGATDTIESTGGTAVARGTASRKVHQTAMARKVDVPADMAKHDIVRLELKKRSASDPFISETIIGKMSVPNGFLGTLSDNFGYEQMEISLRCSKRWIFIPSYRRFSPGRTQALLNYDKACLGDNSLALVVVRSGEFMDYCKAFAGHKLIIVSMPESLNVQYYGDNEATTVEECAGVGFTRLFIQCMAYRLGLETAWMMDDNVVSCRRVDDSGSSFEPCTFDRFMQDIEEIVNSQGTILNAEPGVELLEDPEQPDLLRDATGSFPTKMHGNNASVSVPSFCGSRKHYALIGSERCMLRARQAVEGESEPFGVGGVYSFFWINIKRTVEMRVLYRGKRFWEDIDFNFEADEKGLVVCKVRSILHIKKNLSPAPPPVPRKIPRKSIRQVLRETLKADPQLEFAGGAMRPLKFTPGSTYLNQALELKYAKKKMISESKCKLEAYKPDFINEGDGHIESVDSAKSVVINHLPKKFEWQVKIDASDDIDDEPMDGKDIYDRQFKFAFAPSDPTAFIEKCHQELNLGERDERKESNFIGQMKSIYGKMIHGRIIKPCFNGEKGSYVLLHFDDSTWKALSAYYSEVEGDGADHWKELKEYLEPVDDIKDAVHSATRQPSNIFECAKNDLFREGVNNEEAGEEGYFSFALFKLLKSRMGRTDSMSSAGSKRGLPSADDMDDMSSDYSQHRPKIMKLDYILGTAGDGDEHE